MIISLIAALTYDRVIGLKNKVPWYFPIDMQWFRYHTIFKPVIMGRKTFESIGNKPLSNRLNIVLSHKLLNYSNSSLFIVNSINDALSLIQNANEVMIIGGGAVYNIFLPYAQRLYLTYVNSIIFINGDVWFPEYNINDWKLVFDMFCTVKKNLFYDLNFKIFERL